jgi:hypothetical protein
VAGVTVERAKRCLARDRRARRLRCEEEDGATEEDDVAIIRREALVARKERMIGLCFGVGSSNGLSRLSTAFGICDMATDEGVCEQGRKELETEARE